MLDTIPWWIALPVGGILMVIFVALVLEIEWPFGNKNKENN